MKSLGFLLALAVLFSGCSFLKNTDPPSIETPTSSRTPFQPMRTITSSYWETEQVITNQDNATSKTEGENEHPAEPTYTSTPEPSATLVPEPSATETPQPSATPSIPTEAPTLSISPTPTTPIWPTENKTPATQPTYPPGVMVGNLHMHTTCSDGQDDYEQMIRMALYLGFNFVAITDHSIGGKYTGCATQDNCSEACTGLVDKCRAETRLLCFPGTEITGRVHVLAIGIGPGVQETLPVAEQVARIHEQGGIAIAAHPFSSVWPFSDEALYDSGIDGMECIPGLQTSLEEQQRLAAEHGLPCVYTSDAHVAYYLMTRYMMCTQSFTDVAGLKAALDAGACSMVTPTPKPPK